jgi:hypothetical protein
MDQCPACGAHIERTEFCSWCGFAQQGPESDELRALIRRLNAIDRDLYTRSRERDQVATLLQTKRYEATRGAPVAAPVISPSTPVTPTPRPRQEWNIDRVRTTLLWVGAALLAASAVTFTAVAWSHLGDAGRAALLVGFTGIAMLIAVATRKRLPATAEAFTALTIALGLVDWLAARRAGVGAGSSAATWWAFGAVVIGLLGFALGEVTAPRVGRRAAALLLPTGAVLMITIVAGTWWSFALGLALLAGALVGVRSVVRDDRMMRELLGAEAIIVWIGAAVSAGVAASQPDTFAAAALPALAVLALGVAPFIVRRYEVVVGAVLGALVTIAAPVLAPTALIAFASVCGLLVVAATRWVPKRARDAGLLAGSAFAIPGIAWFATIAAVTTLGPLTWFHFHWTGDLHMTARAVVSGPNTEQWHYGSATALLVAAAAIIALLSLSLPKSRRLIDFDLGVTVAAGVGIAGACMAPVLFSASALVAFATALTVGSAVLMTSAFVDRVRVRLGVALLGVSLVALLPAAGWAAMTARTSITTLAVGAIVATASAVFAQSGIARRALSGLAGASAIVLTAVSAAYAGVPPSEQAFITAGVAGLVFLIGVLARGRDAEGPVLEVIGLLAMAFGTLDAGQSSAWLAGALTIGSVSMFLASLRHDRTIVYAPISAASLLGATGAWLTFAAVPRGESGLLLVALAGAILLIGAHARAHATDGPLLEAVAGAGFVAGAIVAAPATGWLAASLALIVPIMLVAALQHTRAVLYRAAAAATTLGATWAALAARHLPLGEAAFISVAVSSALFLLGTLWRRDEGDGQAVEIVGIAGMVLGGAIAAPTVVWLAAALTLAVPVFALAALREERAQAYGAISVGTALGATWAWLAVAHVTVIEAYTLPAALVAFAAGYITWKRGPGRSWLALGPAIVLALGPSLALAVQHNDPVRSVLVAAAALAVVLIGAQQRLQAPLMIGSAALLILAIDTFGPAAARLPRWVPLAIAGVVLMWVGARFERSREAMQRASRTFQHFG